MIKRLIIQSVLSTLSQVIGRLVNVLIPFLVIASVGATSTTDFFFLALTASFYFYGTVANALSDNLSSRLIVDNKALSPRAGILYALVSGLLVAGFLVSKEWSAEDDGHLIITASLALAAAFGILAVLYTSKLTADQDYYSPGLTWAWRLAIVVIIFGFCQPEKNQIAIFAVCLCAGDFLRITTLWLLARKTNEGRVSKFLKPKEIVALWPYIVGTLLLGLNPVVDRLIASMSHPGAITLLETADRAFWPVVSILTIGFQAVILVSIANLYKAKQLSLQYWNRLILISFLVGLTGSVIVLAIRLLLESAAGEALLSKLSATQIDTVGDCLLVFALLAPVITFGTTCSRLLIVANKNMTILLLCLLSLVSNVVFSYALFIAFGLPGIVAGTVASYLATNVLCYLRTRSIIRKQTWSGRSGAPVPTLEARI